MKKKGLSLLAALLFFSSAMWATDPDYLSFTVTGTGTGIEFYMKKTGSPNDLNLEYSKDNKATWEVVPTAKCTIPCGTTFYVRTKSTEPVTTIGNKDAKNYWAFYLKRITENDTVIISGNVMSLLDQTCQSTTLTEDYVFAYLFAGYTITSTKGGIKIGDLKLPATTLSKGCYQGMFKGQKVNGGALPALPATTLAEDCYREMFRSCNYLKIAIPADYLPATNLAKGCYWGMFNTTAFTSAPALPATELKENCYQEMFYKGKLAEWPELSATTLALYCCDSMFCDCDSITSSIPKDYLPATEMKEGCYKYMFHKCDSVNQFPKLPAMTLAKDCYNNMFSSLYVAGRDSIDLPATELVKGCYSEMFKMSYNPTISVHFTSWGDCSYTTNWLYDGTSRFYGPQALIDELETETIERTTSTVPSKWLVFVLPEVLVLNDNEDNASVLSANLDKEQNIQLMRTFQAGMWNTICLPFALNADQIATAFGADTKVGTMTSGKTIGDELFLDFNTNVTAMEAGQPYIIFPGDDENVVNPTFESVTITTTDAGSYQSPTSEVVFTGVFSPVANLEVSDYYLGVNNTIHSVASGTLKGFRAYFDWWGDPNHDWGAPKRVHMSINGTETTTADEQLQMDEATSTKMMVNGQLVIMRDGIRYNAQGQVIE